MEPTGYAYVTTLDFDETGSFLAAGYSDGTLLVYHRPPDDSKFKVYVRFISHEAEIVNVKWCKGISCNLLLLASDGMLGRVEKRRGKRGREEVRGGSKLCQAFLARNLVSD
jgi:WD40 repeat protein